MELFIPATIGDTSPSSRLFATFLQKGSAQVLQAPGGSRVGQGAARTAAEAMASAQRACRLCARLMNSVWSGYRTEPGATPSVPPSSPRNRTAASNDAWKPRTTRLTSAHRMERAQPRDALGQLAGQVLAAQITASARMVRRPMGCNAASGTAGWGRTCSSHCRRIAGRRASPERCRREASLRRRKPRRAWR